MKKVSRIVCLVLVLMFVCIPVSGASQYKNIKVESAKSKIVIDGKTVKMDNFVYNGKTYVPLNDITKQLESSNKYSKTKKTNTVTTFKDDLEILNSALMVYSKFYHIAANIRTFLDVIDMYCALDYDEQSKNYSNLQKHYDIYLDMNFTQDIESLSRVVNSFKWHKDYELLLDDAADFVYWLELIDTNTQNMQLSIFGESTSYDSYESILSDIDIYYSRIIDMRYTAYENQEKLVSKIAKLYK